MRSFLKNMSRAVKSEIEFDTWYHSILSVAVISKIIFISSAIFCYIEERNNKTDTNIFKRFIHVKDIANELTIALVCLLMIYVFNPFNKNFCVDSHFKTLLFMFAIFTLAEIHWVVFTTKVYPTSNLVQFFFGRIGTMSGQIKRDKTHSEYYAGTSWEM